MTATNHVLTGIVIASTIHAPLIALPLALVSHFVLDAIPHFANQFIGFSDFKFKLILGTDIYIAGMCLLMVFFLHPARMWIILFGGILAASPDLMWLPDFVAALRREPAPAQNRLRRLHSKIQWYQKPNGIWVEAVWFVVAFIAAFAFTI